MQLSSFWRLWFQNDRFLAFKVFVPSYSVLYKYCTERKTGKLLMDSSIGRVRVILRIRPLVRAELMDGGGVSVQARGSSIFLQNDTSYMFDSVLGPESSQEDVSAEVLNGLLAPFIQGYNCTAFAYGQTGAGKSYTIGVPNQTSLSYVEACLGEANKESHAGADVSDVDVDPQTKFASVGLIPRFLVQLFDALASIQSVWKVRVSFLEVYNETLRDLLSPETDSSSLCIRDYKGKVVVQNLTEREVSNAKDAARCFVNGGILRVTAVTAMNERSSRSHSIFTVTLERVQDNKKFLSKFSFVDLAGSERAKKSGATGLQFKEMVGINSGLLALGNVISALAANQDSREKRHVPYRDSKLTRLLQDSLGGSSTTIMIANISPFTGNFDETNSTILYAARARNIINVPVACHEELNLGQAQDQVRQLIKELEKENLTMKADLDRVRKQRDDLRGEIEILEAQLLERNARLITMAKGAALEPSTQQALGSNQLDNLGNLSVNAGVKEIPEVVRELVRSNCIAIEQEFGTFYAPKKIQTVRLLLDLLTDYICKTYPVDNSNYNDVFKALVNQNVISSLKSASARSSTGTGGKAAGPSFTKKKASSSKQLLTNEHNSAMFSDTVVATLIDALLLLRKAGSASLNKRKKQPRKSSRAALREHSKLDNQQGNTEAPSTNGVLSEQLSKESVIFTNTSSSTSLLKVSMLDKSTSSNVSPVNVSEFLDRSLYEHNNKGEGDEEQQDVYDLAYKDIVDNTRNVPEGSAALTAIKDLIKRLISKEACPEEIYHSTVTAMMALQKQQEHILELEGQMTYIQQKVQGKTCDENVIELRTRIKTLEEEHRVALEELRTKEQVQLAMNQVQARFQSMIERYKKEIIEKTRACEEANRLLKSQRMNQSFNETPIKPKRPGSNRLSMGQMHAHRRVQSNTEHAFAMIDSGYAPAVHAKHAHHLSSVNMMDCRPKSKKDTGQSHKKLGNRDTKLAELDRKLEDLQSLYAYNAKNEEVLRNRVEELEAERDSLASEKLSLQKRLSQLEQDIKMRVVSPVRASVEGVPQLRRQLQQQPRPRQSSGASGTPQAANQRERNPDELKGLQLQGLPMLGARQKS
ncbi:Kinesin motor domain protein [Giardia duodenalis]|uniref:Kinesin motor domain protein n=1 Tax=Giardia intestinalis TaxID=5741 RepID=V6TKC9_GIAIN|nr:Kinesin motor domain protein [Giardia intestinalis]